jgi:lysophospholipase L1-like esterase
MAQLATQAAVASWRTAVAALGVNSVTLMHGTNDQGAGATPATFGSNGDTVVTGLRAAVPGVDILWAMPAENQRTSNAFPMPDYKSAASEKAATANVSFIDTQRNFGDPYAPLEYGSSGAFPLFNADLIHPEPSTGGRALLSAFLSFLHR